MHSAMSSMREKQRENINFNTLTTSLHQQKEFYEENREWFTLSPTVDKSWPSNRMSPESRSHNLNKHERRVDFPAPVLPTMPTFSPLLMFAVKSFKESGKSLRYLMFTELKVRSPVLGHPFSRRAASSGSTRGASVGKSPVGRNSNKRSKACVRSR